LREITVLALVWSWHVFWLGLLTCSVGRAAYSHTGSPFRRHPRWLHLFWKIKVPKPFYWPVSGRWLLTALLLLITIMIFDVTRVTWIIAHHHYPTTITWWNVIVRASPIIIEPWTFWRQWRRGLTNDYPKKPAITKDVI
jgi:hypothetical protein